MTHGILWAGTGDGRIVLIDSKSGKLINVSHRYDGAIRALKTSPCKSKDYGFTPFWQHFIHFIKVKKDISYHYNSS